MKRRRAPRLALPVGVDLADCYFQPTREEKLLDWLRSLERKWAKEDDLRRRQRERQIAAEIEADRRKQAESEARAERQEQLERERAYWLKEQKAGAAVMEKLVEQLQNQLEGGWRRKALAKLDKLTKEIERDKVKAERKELEKRCVIRGRRA